jgi:hypothetical protein
MAGWLAGWLTGCRTALHPVHERTFRYAAHTKLLLLDGKLAQVASERLFVVQFASSPPVVCHKYTLGPPWCALRNLTRAMTPFVHVRACVRVCVCVRGVDRLV